MNAVSMQQSPQHARKEKKRKEMKRKRYDYAVQGQFNEKPSIIPGCPGPSMQPVTHALRLAMSHEVIVNNV